MFIITTISTLVKALAVTAPEVSVQVNTLVPDMNTISVLICDDGYDNFDLRLTFHQDALFRDTVSLTEAQVEYYRTEGNKIVRVYGTDLTVEEVVKQLKQ